MKTFSKEEILDYRDLHIKNWKFENNSLKRDFKFRSFVDAFSFMTAVALEAEKMNHHPDWSNGFNRVSVSITNHSAGGITQLDFDLAEKMDRIFNNFPQLA
jgi:4a-hydroxytetrahydrobiopterin dehydratase